MAQIIPRGNRYLVRTSNGRTPTGKRIYINCTVDSIEEALAIHAETLNNTCRPALPRNSTSTNSKIIYAVQMIDGINDYVKIGQTTAFIGRLEALRCSSPYPLKVIVTFLADDFIQAEETVIHQKFAHLRVRREWFKPEKELLDWLRKRAAGVTMSATKQAQAAQHCC